MRPFATLIFLAVHAISLRAQEADLILTMNSYGPIQVGAPISEVHRQLARLGRKNLPSSAAVSKTGCAYYQASNDLRFMVEDGKVVRIETREKNVVTPSGVRVGTTIERVRRAFGSRIEDLQQHYSENTNDRTIVLVSGDKQFAIRVEANQVVTEIYAGAEHAIRYVEGCA